MRAPPNEKVDLICDQCKCIFRAPPSEVKKGRHLCSWECYKQYKRHWPSSDVVKHLYWDEELPMWEIAQALGYTYYQIKSVFKHYSIPKRDQSTVTKLQIAKGTRKIPSRKGHKSPGSQKGVRNTNWQGGRIYRNRIKNSRGYVYVYAPDHPRANMNGRGEKAYVAEHIVVWEKAHNKPLPKGWMVHHLNGVTDDNRPQNLVGLPSKRHYGVLKAKAGRIKNLEIENRQLKRALEDGQMLFYIGEN